MQQKTFDLTTLNGRNGFSVSGSVQGDRLGYSVASTGDINGDGVSDLVLGAYRVNSNAGAAYVIFGMRNGYLGTFDLGTLSGSNGFTVPGIEPGVYHLGISVSAAGDINGDGVSDFVLGADDGYGTSYVIFGSRGGFQSVFNLMNLNGTNGFIVRGIALNGGLGGSVSTAGDVNGDGISDLVLGAYSVNSYAGAAYVIFGQREQFPALFNLTNLNGINGFSVAGIAPNDLLGCVVNTAGDINGDGISDLVLGAYNANTGLGGNGGAGYVIFGRREGFASFFNLSNINGTNGFAIGSAASATLGGSISTVGDINGDGISDLGLSDASLNSGTGVSYIIFGNRQGFSSLFNLNKLNGSNGFAVPGVAARSYLGPVSSVGDISDDGIDDLVLGADGTANAANLVMGVAYVIFGNRVGFPSTFNLNNLNGTNGFIVPGIAVNSSLGFSVSRAGDINGDGLNDLLLGAPGLNSDIGTAYIIFGKFQLAWVSNQLIITQGQTVPITLDNLNATVINNPTAIITFTVSNVEGGRFALVSNPTLPLFRFTQTEIESDQIQFISDRTAPVAYQVNATDGQSILPTIPGNVTFINHPPQIVNAPKTQILTVNQSFDFHLVANQTFFDPDEDPLTYSAKLNDGSMLPNWLHFDNAQANQLHFNGTAPSMTEGITVNLFARDPLNASVSTQFQVVTVPPLNNATTNIVADTGLSEITGGVIGGVLGLTAAISAGLGFWRYATNKTSRSTEQFADFIRSALNLKEIDNFDHETGQKYLTFVHELQKGLQQAGIDPSTMRSGELRELANDVAVAARNKITPATNCFGRSAITVTDLNDNLQSLLNEIQVLRGAGQRREYTV
jgi:hypothetical protein